MGCLVPFGRNGCVGCVGCLLPVTLAAISLLGLLGWRLGHPVGGVARVIASAHVTAAR